MQRADLAFSRTLARGNVISLMWEYCLLFCADVVLGGRAGYLRRAGPGGCPRGHDSGGGQAGADRRVPAAGPGASGGYNRRPYLQSV